MSGSDGESHSRSRTPNLATDHEYLCCHVSRTCGADADDAEQVRLAILQQCFEAASHVDARDSNRRKLYAIWRAGMQDCEQAELDGT